MCATQLQQRAARLTCQCTAATLQAAVKDMSEERESAFTRVGERAHDDAHILYRKQSGAGWSVRRACNVPTCVCGMHVHSRASRARHAPLPHDAASVLALQSSRSLSGGCAVRLSAQPPSGCAILLMEGAAQRRGTLQLHRGSFRRRCTVARRPSTMGSAW